MALYNELPVYKATYQLLHVLVQMSVSWQRDYRYTLGQELKQLLISLLVVIYRANSTREKAPIIGEARELTEKVKIYIRLLHDLGQIGARQYTSLVEQVGSISKQLARWHEHSIPKSEA